MEKHGTVDSAFLKLNIPQGLFNHLKFIDILWDLCSADNTLRNVDLADTHMFDYTTMIHHLPPNEKQSLENEMH